MLEQLESCCMVCAAILEIITKAREVSFRTDMLEQNITFNFVKIVTDKRLKIQVFLMF